MRMDTLADPMSMDTPALPNALRDDLSTSDCSKASPNAGGQGQALLLHNAIFLIVSIVYQTRAPFICKASAFHLTATSPAVDVGLF